jgi:hypothetical protein
MSMTLILWKAPVVDDPDEAKALLTPWYATDDESVFEPSNDLKTVYDILLKQYPFDWERASDPWADPPQVTDRLLVLGIRWGTQSRVLADITALARKFGLVLYDPQGPDVFLSTDPIEEVTESPPPTAWEWFKSLAIPAVLLALTYAAWLIPIGWIRWPAVIVAGFFLAAGLFVSGLMIAAALGFINVNERA